MLYLVLVCVGVIGVGEDVGAAGDCDGEGVVLAWLLVVLVFPMVLMLAVAALGAGLWLARVWSLAGVGLLLVLL